MLNSFNPELQIKDAESAIRSNLIELFTQLKGFKFVTTLVLAFKNMKAKIKQSMTIFIQAQKHKSLGKGSGWIIDSAIDHTISMPRYNLLTGRSGIKSPKELDHSRKGLDNIQSTEIMNDLNSV